MELEVDHGETEAFSRSGGAANALTQIEKFRAPCTASACSTLAREAELPGVPINVVFDLAAETHVDRSVDHPAAFIEINVSGTYALLEAALRYWSALDGSRGGQGVPEVHCHRRITKPYLGDDWHWSTRGGVAHSRRTRT
jgi:hypothetical protein